MKKKVLCMSLAAMLLSQTGVMATQEHKHVWIDDIKNSDETTNRYYCECGEVRDEIIADIRNFVVSFDANGGYVETETVETKKSGNRTNKSTAWPGGFNGYHHCGASRYVLRYDPGSRADCAVFCSHYFCRVLLGLASVCFPRPRKEMVEIGIALITQLREYLPFLNAIFWR